jgi:hypothetical protein
VGLVPVLVAVDRLDGADGAVEAGDAVESADLPVQVEIVDGERLWHGELGRGNAPQEQIACPERLT